MYNVNIMIRKYDWKIAQEYYDNDHTIREMRDKFGMAHRTVQVAAARGDFIRRDRKESYRIYLEKNPYIKFSWEEIQEYYNCGHSTRETADHFSVNVVSISKATRRGDFVPRNMSEALKLRFKRDGPNYPGPEARARLSKVQSENNRGGKCKWFTVAGKKVQGTWERDLALVFEELQIKWVRPKCWLYEMNGKQRRYSPDFYLPDYDLYLELKGYWWGNDRQKMDAVLEQHQDKRIMIIEKELYKEIV